MKQGRVLFFWTMVIIFIFAAPAMVLYAQGYRFDFQRGILVHSGTISIKSNPQNIDITLNGKLNKSGSLNHINNSYNLSGLMPGNYDLSVSADGYQTWTKKTEVHSGLASEFWNVLLVKNNYARTDYNADGIDKFYISPKNRYIIYTRNSDSGLSVSILNIGNKQIANSFNFNGWNFIDEARKENIEWSPNEDYVSVPVEKTVSNTGSKQIVAKTVQYAYFILNPSANTSFNLNDFLQKDDIRYVRWDPQNKNYLFFLSQNNLFRADINNASDIKEIAQNVSSFDLSRTNVYYSQMPNELVFKANLDGSGTPTQLTANFPENLTSPNSRLVVYDDSRIAFLNQNKNLYIYNLGEHGTYFKKLASDIDGMQFSNDGKKLLFWTDNEISVYYLRDWNVAPTRTENSIEDITRYSDRIKNVQWFKDYEHIIFSTGSQMKIIELDPRDHRNCMNLIQTAVSAPFAVYDSAQGRLYFTDNKNSSASLYSIVFPEPTPILGIYTPPGG